MYVLASCSISDVHFIRYDANEVKYKCYLLLPLSTVPMSSIGYWLNFTISTPIIDILVVGCSGLSQECFILAIRNQCCIHVCDVYNIQRIDGFCNDIEGCVCVLAQDTQLHSSKKTYIIRLRKKLMSKKQLPWSHLRHTDSSVPFCFLLLTHYIVLSWHVWKCTIACPVSAWPWGSLIGPDWNGWALLNRPSEVTITRRHSAAIIAIAKLTIKWAPSSAQLDTLPTSWH